jgi:hypothetical protein
MREEVHQALRRWARRPALAAGIIVMLALGIGATTALVSILRAVVWPTQPWPQPDRLVLIHAVRVDQRANPAYEGRWNRAPISWASWRDLERTSAFEGVGVWMSEQQILGHSRRDLAQVLVVSSSFFSVLGMRPAMGRLFNASEDESPSDGVLVSHEAWQRRFGGASGVLDDTVVLAANHPGSQPFTRDVVGILPPGFRFLGESPEFVLPIGALAHAGSFETNRFLRAVGRLRPGVSIDQAVVEATPFVTRSEPPDRRGARVVSIAEDQFGSTTRPLWLMLAGAGLLLAIACSNVAGFLLVDAGRRRGETVVRVALGATPAMLMRQRAAEQLLLAVTASGVGVLLASWLTPLLVAIGPAVLQSAASITVEYQVAGGSLVLGLVTVGLFGLAPTLALLKEGVEIRTAAVRVATRPGFRWHRTLVAGQIALAFVLLVTATLFADVVLGLQSTPLGFNPAGLSVVTIKQTRTPPRPAITGAIKVTPDDPNGRLAMMRLRSSSWMHTAGVLSELTALPGVVSSAAVSAAPFTRPAPSVQVRDATRSTNDAIAAQYHVVSHRYLATMGIRLLRGRDFDPSDQNNPAVRPVMVSSELERLAFGGDAVGKALVWDDFEYPVVGVIDNVKQLGASEVGLAAFYGLEYTAGSVDALLVRSRDESPDILPAIRRVIDQYDPHMLVTSTSAMTELVAASMTGERFRAVLSGAFAVVAFLLAAIGLFGLVGHLVAERQREIGVRIALGASPADVRGLVLRDACVILGGGFVIGLPAAYGAASVVRSLFDGVPITDASPVLVAAVALSFAAVAAVIGPMIRATRVDPVHTLKE